MNVTTHRGKKFVTICYTWSRSFDVFFGKTYSKDLSGSGCGTVGGSCEHGNERPNSIKCWEIPEQMSD